jgi:hypothetical protein
LLVILVERIVIFNFGEPSAEPKVHFFLVCRLFWSILFFFLKQKNKTLHALNQKKNNAVVLCEQKNVWILPSAKLHFSCDSENFLRIRPHLVDDRDAFQAGDRRRRWLDRRLELEVSNSCHVHEPRSARARDVLIALQQARNCRRPARAHLEIRQAAKDP